MRTYFATVIIASALGLAGCGGKKDEPPVGGTPAESSGQAEAPKSSPAGIAVTKEQKVANTYLAELTAIGDALTSVTDDASAQKAAQTIALASQTMEAAKAEFGDVLSGPQAIAIFMPRQQEFIAAQQKISTGMTQIATSHPEFLQMISEEMKNMPAVN